MAENLTRRNVVLETLRGSRREIYTLWVEQDLNQKELTPILQAAKNRRVPIQAVSKQKLNQKAGDSRHQGVLVEAGPYLYSDLDAMFALAEARQEKMMLLILDLLHGPQNIGTLLRTAEICGAHGVIVQDRRAPDITPAVVQYAAGASEHLLIAQVTNLVQTIDKLKERSVWVAGLDMDPSGQRLGEIDLDLPIGLVVGHEGSGLRRLVRKKCDFLLHLPMRGQVESLNAAVAGSILLYAVWQARGFPGAK